MPWRDSALEEGPLATMPRDTEFLCTTDPSILSAPHEVLVLLRKTNWDDHGYRTEFDLGISIKGGPLHRIGRWKILKTSAREPRVADPVETQLKDQFRRLPPGFVSLAQDLNQYRALADLGVDVARTVLDAIRDVAYVRPSGEAERIKGFVTSLTRSTRALDAYRKGRALLAELAVLEQERLPATPDPMKFQFHCRLESPETSIVQIGFDFSNDPSSLGLHRMWVLAGTNGSGKTQVLAAMARALSGLETANTQVAPRPSFSKIIAMSYSPWDQFNRPRDDGRTGYVYCGLRALGNSPQPQHQDAHKTARDEAPLDLDGARRRAAADLFYLTHASKTRQRWRRAMESCGLNRPGTPLARVLEHGEFVEALGQSSAGEQLAAIVVTRLVRHLEPSALVLFDEPELHMHPSLLSGLLRTMHELLVERDAYAILATHSPIPLQEIPRSCVRVFDVDGPTVHVRTPDDQCFGATIGDILSSVFRGRQDERNWANFIVEIRKRGFSNEDIDHALHGDLGLGVQMLLAALQSNEVVDQ